MVKPRERRRVSRSHIAVKCIVMVWMDGTVACQRSGKTGMTISHLTISRKANMKVSNHFQIAARGSQEHRETFWIDLTVACRRSGETAPSCRVRHDSDGSELATLMVMDLMATSRYREPADSVELKR
jgi:hypothetical protein